MSPGVPGYPVSPANRDSPAPAPGVSERGFPGLKIQVPRHPGYQVPPVPTTLAASLAGTLAEDFSDTPVITVNYNGDW